MQTDVITVSQFLELVNETLAISFPQVTIEAEITSYKVNQNKFVFFDLKDSDASISCFMMLYALRVPLEDGMKVRVSGTPKLTKWGKFSLTVRSVEPAGEGELRRAQELLRQKLEAEGLFAEARKRPIPTFPQRIGLITSATSAAYADFIKILNARWSGVTVYVADVTVQGRTAPDQVVGALQHLNVSSPAVDVIVLIRGGGSLEDLAAFSTEPVARAVASSRIPVVVGVGHEVDISLADLAADLRAATPTDAARLVVPDRHEVSSRINHSRVRLDSSVTSALERRRLVIERALSGLGRYVSRPQRQLQVFRTELARSLERLSARRTSDELQVRRSLDELSNRLARQIREKSQSVIALRRLIHSAGPEATLGRGYAIVTHHNHVVTSSDQVPSGSAVMVKLRQGYLQATTDTHGKN